MFNLFCDKSLLLLIIRQLEARGTVTTVPDTTAPGLVWGLLSFIGCDSALFYIFLAALIEAHRLYNLKKNLQHGDTPCLLLAFQFQIDRLTVNNGITHMRAIFIVAPCISDLNSLHFHGLLKQKSFLSFIILETTSSELYVFACHAATTFRYSKYTTR